MYAKLLAVVNVFEKKKLCFLSVVSFSGNPSVLTAGKHIIEVSFAHVGFVLSESEYFYKLFLMFLNIITLKTYRKF